MPRLTQKLAAGAACPAGLSELMLWDDVVVGFGLRVRTSGHKTWLVRYMRGGRKFKHTIGPANVLTADEARERARNALVLVIDGRDPAEERRGLRAGMTVADLADLFLGDRADTPGHRTYSSAIRRHIKPLLGKLTVAAVTEADCVDALRQIKAGHTKASPEGRRRGRVRLAKGASIAKFAHGTLTAMFGTSEARHLRKGKGNPMEEIARPKVTPRRMALSLEQYADVGAALLRMGYARTAPPGALDAIWLLALTGFRKSEVTGAPLAACDPAKQVLHLTKSKTGERLAVMGAAAAALVRRRLEEAEEGDRWLVAPFAGRRTPVGIEATWIKVRKAAGLPKLRLHDLRHSYATIAVAELGVAYPIIQALLGHAGGAGGGDRAYGMRGTTAEYLHIGFSAVRTEADRIAAAIYAAMTRGLPALAEPPPLLQHQPAPAEKGGAP